MMQKIEPANYVIAIGVNRSIREFFQKDFETVGIEIEWENKGVKEKGMEKRSGKMLVEVNPDFYRPAEVNPLLGEYSKAKAKLEWQLKTPFNELVGIMVEKD